MKTLFILNDAPYGTERCFNALRLAQALLKNESDVDVTVFLMADSVAAAHKGQKTPDGYFNTGRMLERIIADEGRVLLCGACMDARGVIEEAMIDGAQRSTMAELAEETIVADKVLVF